MQETEGGQKSANYVTEIVMSMQFQDVSRQRLERGIGLPAQLQTEVGQGEPNHAVFATTDSAFILS